MDTIKVMIVDDHAIIREIIENILGDCDDISLVKKAENGKEGLDFLIHNHVDIILLDILMPGINGLKVLEEVKKMKSPPKVIMLTGCKDKTVALQALNMGAEGYLSKEVDTSHIILAIKEVMAGNSYIYPPISKLIKDDMDHIKREIEEATKIDRLTSREFEVMTLIAKGMSNIKISQTLSISDKTVKNHVSSILKKLEFQDRTQIAIYALNNNYDKYPKE